MKRSLVCFNNLESLKNKYCALNTENEQLKKLKIIKVNDQKQYTRLNCLEILGASETRN